MDVDLQAPGSGPNGSRRAAEVVVPHPVPSGFLDSIIESLGTGRGAGGLVTFADAAGLSPEVRVGWQVGVLVRLLPFGFTPSGGVDPVVVRRVREVLSRVEDAR